MPFEVHRAFRARIHTAFMAASIRECPVNTTTNTAAACYTIAHLPGASFALEHACDLAVRGSRRHRSLLAQWVGTDEGKAYHADALANRAAIAAMQAADRRKAEQERNQRTADFRRREVQRNGVGVGQGLSRFKKAKPPAPVAVPARALAAPVSEVSPTEEQAAAIAA